MARQGLPLAIKVRMEPAILSIDRARIPGLQHILAQHGLRGRSILAIAGRARWQIGGETGRCRRRLLRGSGWGRALEEQGTADCDEAAKVWCKHVAAAPLSRQRHLRGGLRVDRAALLLPARERQAEDPYGELARTLCKGVLAAAAVANT